MGTADLTLQANNDITIVDTLDATATSAGGSLTLQAGRAILVQASVILEGSFTATTNDANRAGSGNRRDDGDATFLMSDGVTIDTSTGNRDISISASIGGSDSDDDSGNIVIETLNAGTGNVTLPNDGNDNSRGILRASADSLIAGESLNLSVTSTATGAVDDSIGLVTDPILTRVSNLSATTVGSGLFISNTGDLNLTNLNSTSGVVDVRSIADTAAGDDGSITITSVNVNNNLTIESNNGSITHADGAIQAGSATVV